MAEQRGLPLMTICSTCQGVMSQANHRLKADPGLPHLHQTSTLNRRALSYNGTTEVKHFMWILVEDYGLDRLKEHVTKPLTGLALAPFYGCYVVRAHGEAGLLTNFRSAARTSNS